MIRVLLIAAVSAVASLGSNFATTRYLAARHDQSHADPAKPAIEQKKTRTINVPILAHGQVQGYVVAQFIYSTDAAALKSASSSPEPYILDEAFRMIYGDDKLDFAKLERVDIARLTTDLRQRVVARMKSDIVKDILVQEFNYVSKDEIRK